MKLVSLIILLILSVVSIQATGQFDYECRLKERPQSVILQQTNPPVVGKPGKRGPVGPKGQKGDTVTGTAPETQVKDAVSEYFTTARPEGCPRNGVDGVTRIYPVPFNNVGIRVYCDVSTDGGGWIVIQRRVDGSMDFYRAWKEYANGFGNKYGEFWFGLENLHRLTSEGNYELRVDVGDFEGNFAYGKYNVFKIASAGDNYQLTVTGYSGTSSGDPMSYHNGMYFTTKDLDNDIYDSGNCAVSYTGAWWYGTCHSSNLNGKYLEGGVVDPKGIAWRLWKGNYYSMQFSEMKIRKID